MNLSRSLWRYLAIITLFGTAIASDTDGYEDPYLQFRPDFARSLPVQILLTGIVLTLVAVLFIHLIFTAPYHWPLAPVNYVLQLSGVTTLLISLIATLHVVLSASIAESEKWPYMLSYIAVNVPPLDLEESNDNWTIAERATWLVMNASTSGLIQITHIQFLTLLYPSRLEGRLIFCLLGPLAIVAAVMQLLPINGSSNVNIFASAVRNVCNATLSLLFTIALFIWGLLVNRKQAWRTDGGTAAFGCAALALALVGTALNFLYVPREDQYVWLPGLMWAIILWQSFLGWWWWVGAGSGSGMHNEEEMEEKMRKQAKRDSRRKEAERRRKETKTRAKNVWRGVAGAFSNRDGQDNDDESSSMRRSLSGSGGSPPSSSSNPRSRAHRTHTSAYSVTTGTSGTTGAQRFPAFVHRWYASLRKAHVAAARQQAVEHEERIRQLERNRTSNPVRSRWGLGKLWRPPRDNQNTSHEGRQRKNNASRSPSSDTSALSNGQNREYRTRTRRRSRNVDSEGEAERQSEDWNRSYRRDGRHSMDDHENEDDEQVRGERVVYRRRQRERERNERAQDLYSHSRSDDDLSVAGDIDDDADTIVHDEHPPTDIHRRRHQHQQQRRRHRSPSQPHSPPLPASAIRSSISATPPTMVTAMTETERRGRPQGRSQPHPSPQAQPEAWERRSLWWWGPLWRWRLQDSTVYQ